MTNTQRCVIIFAAVRMIGFDEVDALLSGQEEPHSTKARRLAQYVNDVFQVGDITRWHRSKDLAYFAMILTNHDGRYEAIAGPQAETLAVNDMIYVRCCFMLRKGERVLVIYSVKRLARLDPR